MLDQGISANNEKKRNIEIKVINNSLLYFRNCLQILKPLTFTYKMFIYC